MHNLKFIVTSFRYIYLYKYIYICKYLYLLLIKQSLIYYIFIYPRNRQQPVLSYRQSRTNDSYAMNIIFVIIIRIYLEFRTSKKVNVK